MTNAKKNTCRACKGTGTRPNFSHVENGRCFRCNGKGTVLTAAEKRAKKAHDDLATAIREVEARKASLAELISYHAECAAKDRAKGMDEVRLAKRQARYAEDEAAEGEMVAFWVAKVNALYDAKIKDVRVKAAHASIAGFGG